MTKKIVNLGDSSFAEYGGLLVRPNGECEYFEAESRTVYRFTPDKCSYVGGVLSDNPYHPELRAWFADSADSIAECSGYSHPDFISALCSDDVTKRAAAYESIGLYHGFDNLDSYPLTLSRAECNRRYSRIPRH